MKVKVPLMALVFGLSFCGLRPARALDVTLDSGGTSLTIVDNDGNDASPDVDVIDFDVSSSPVGGIFSAAGRVIQEPGLLTRYLTFTATPPATDAVLQNTSLSAENFTITINSSSFTTLTPPLGWSVSYSARAEDPSPDDVEITSHEISLYADGSELLSTLTLLPISPPVAPVDQPVQIDDGIAAADPVGDASSARIVFTFSPGPGDRIRVPGDPELEGLGITVALFDNNLKCVEKTTQLARDLGKRATLADVKCMRVTTFSGGGDATPCIDSATDISTDRSETKLLDFMDTRCQAPPAWGVNGAGCCENSSNDGAGCGMDADCPGGTCRPGACISAAAEQATNDLTHDLFGSTVDAFDFNGPYFCQRMGLSGVQKLLDTRWTVHRVCERANFSTITDDASLVATCLSPTQSDPHLRNDRGLESFRRTLDYNCTRHGVSPLGTVFPGLCAGAADEDFADCMAARAACRFCLAVNQADAIDPATDCDLFDDGTANASCPP